MIELSEKEKLAQVSPADRVLLLSHCLRPSQTCPGKFDKKGLKCPDDCAEDCIIQRLRSQALSYGYKGVCIAAGGAMALRFIKEHQPRAIVAMACEKELMEGVHGVEAMTGEEDRPSIVVVPLSKDGCVDTEIDEGQARKAISLGLPPPGE